VSEQRCKSSSNIFQPAEPEKLNPRSPNLVLVQRLTYLAVFAERRPDRRLAEVTDWTASVKYWGTVPKCTLYSNIVYSKMRHRFHIFFYVPAVVPRHLVPSPHDSRNICFYPRRVSVESTGWGLVIPTPLHLSDASHTPNKLCKLS